MKKRFFDHIAEDLLRSHNGDLSRVVVVLPSRRARLYLTDALRRATSRTFWLPTYLVFPELLSWLSGERIASAMEQMLLLYDCHRSGRQASESFTVFSSWAGLALRDFSDLDASMADPERVFVDLRNIREIENWSFNKEDLDEAQLAYLKFWQDLHSLYSAFSRAQQEQGIWTYSALARHCADARTKFIRDTGAWKFYFVGLAGLSVAESALIQKIGASSVCEILSDLDNYYVDNPFQEAGLFARRSPVHKWVFDDLKNSSAEVEIYECSTSVAEVMALASHLVKMGADDLQDSVVVLADESSLDVLITCLPELPCPLNLAVGIPVQRTIPGKWLRHIFKIRNQRHSTGKGIFHSDLSEYFHLISMMGCESESCREVLREIVSGGYVYTGDSRLRKWAERFPALADLLRLIEKDCGWQECLKKLEEVSFPFTVGNEMHALAWDHLKEVVAEVRMVVDQKPFFQDEETISALMQSYCSREKLHYKGEPLRGLQVVNLAETRAIDFSHVFILGANDHVFPGSAHEQSLIPLELRAYFKLPLPEQKEAHIAYSFYRLLQRADKVKIYYSSVGGDLRSSEKSRYITQLEDEWPSLAPAIRIHKGRVQSVAMKHDAPNAPVMDEFAQRRLDTLLEYGISPSAINKFNACPQDFYFRYIIGLGEEEIIEEDISSAVFGTIVHHVMENFYRPFIGGYPLPAKYDEAIGSLDERIERALDETCPSLERNSGYNRLALKIASRMLSNLFNYEKKEAEERLKSSVSSRIIDVERAFVREINAASYGWNKTLRIRGKLDRIEEVNGRVRIIDYKTGKLGGVSLEFDTQSEKIILQDAKSDKRIQLLTYLYLYEPELKQGQEMMAGLFGLQEIKNGCRFLESNGQTSFTSISEFFERQFMAWVQEVYQSQEFLHKTDRSYCSYCISS